MTHEPLVVNFDSAMDWTAEVRSLWAALDWEQVRRAVAPSVDPEAWSRRIGELGVIGLASSLAMQRTREEPPWQWCDKKRDDDELLRQRWLERQQGRRNNDDRPRFSGEEPFLQPPCVVSGGIAECFGIYVTDPDPLFRSLGWDASRIPAELRKRAAILLCPERLHEVYPSVMRVSETLRHAPPLSSNPALMNLRLTLLHELGHHLFPVHRAGAGDYLCEALANLFCYRAISQDEQAWLLYKSWFLQPPEYSAYRPLSVICEADADIARATEACFEGTLDAWSMLPVKGQPVWELATGAGRTMALGLDHAACIGTWRMGLGRLMSQANKWLLPWDGGDVPLAMVDRHRGEGVPADLLLDLYRQRDVSRWLRTADAPDDFWCRWSCSAVSWPQDSMRFESDDIDQWMDMFAVEKPSWRWQALLACLVQLLHAEPGAGSSKGRTRACDRAVAVVLDKGAEWYTRVDAIRLLAAASWTPAIPILEAIGARASSDDVARAAVEALASLRGRCVSESQRLE